MQAGYLATKQLSVLIRNHTVTPEAGPAIIQRIAA